MSEKESLILDSFSNVSISEWSYYYTSGVHLAGTNQSQAQWTADRWSENGIPSSLVAYNVFLNFPLDHALSLSYPNGSTFNATLKEDVLEEDPTSSDPNRIPTFHGYSFTGKASAEYVYVGYVPLRSQLQFVANCSSWLTTRAVEDGGRILKGL